MSKTTNLSALSDVVSTAGNNLKFTNAGSNIELRADAINTAIDFDPATATGGALFYNTADEGFYRFHRSTDNGNAWNMDKEGRVTMPYQPAFKVGSNQNWMTIPANSVIPWNTSVQNIGNNFNFATGEFTAPISGTYFFHTNLYINSGSHSFYFTKNGAFQSAGGGDAIVYYWHSTSSDKSYQPCFQIYLSAGDYVSFKSRNTQSSVVYGPHSYFAGYLIG